MKTVFLSRYPSISLVIGSGAMLEITENNLSQFPLRILFPVKAVSSDQSFFCGPQRNNVLGSRFTMI